MESDKQPNGENCRVFIFDRDRTQVLLVDDEDSCFVLPSVEIPRWERVADNLTAAVRNKWNCGAISLFAPEVPRLGNASNGHRYQVMECWCSDESPRSKTIWTSTRALTRQAFRDSADYEVLEQCLREFDLYAGDPASPFAKSGWFTELQSWIADVIRPMGLRLSGPFRQLNGSPSFSLIRFETNGSAVWFKAVGKPNLHEFPITLALGTHLPGWVAPILASRAPWNGWLALGVDGTELGGSHDAHDWRMAASALGMLQTESALKVGALRDAGARDLSTTSLLKLVDPFFEAIEQLLEHQMSTTVLFLKDALLLREQVRRALFRFGDLGIPDALGHLDLNPGNVIVCGEHCVFLDWAEAYVGHPFFSFQYLCEHFRRVPQVMDAAGAQLADAYTQHWRSWVPSENITQALALARMLAVFVYAAAMNGWRVETTLQEPQIGRHLLSLVRRMKREANELRSQATVGGK